MPRKNPLGILTAASQAVSLADKVSQLGLKAKRKATKSRKKIPRPAAVKRNFTQRTAVSASGGGFGLSAPVATGVVFRGSDFNFGTAPPMGGMKGLRIHAKQVWGYIKSGASGSQLFTNWSNVNVPFLTFDPNDSVTMPPPLVELGQVFGRYVLRRARLATTPGGAGANTGATLGMAMCVVTDAGSALPTTAQSIVQLSNSISGPLWEQLELEVPCDGQARFVYQSTADGSLTIAEARQDHAFAVAGRFDNTPAATTFYGYLHLDYMLDLYEVTNPPVESSLRRARLESKGETPTREEVKAPITPSLEARPQGGLSGGWSVVPPHSERAPHRDCDCGTLTTQHAIDCAGYLRQSEPPSVRKAQSTKS